MAERNERAPKRNVTIRFSEDEIQWLKAEADKELRPVAMFVRWVLAEYRKQKEGGNKQC